MNTSHDQSEALLTAEILRGRQSVRATFRLPDQLISLLSVAAGQLGLKQKTLFDHLADDPQILMEMAQNVEDEARETDDLRQKTFVISRRTLVVLESVAKDCGLPRDLVVELSLRRLLPIVSAEQERQKLRQKLLRRLEAYCRQGRELCEEAAELLGEDDPAVLQLDAMMLQGERACTELQLQVEQGRELEQFL
ncbi:MAG: hypothetical protein ACOX5Z_01875 [Desulfobulbus sp.]|jgi:hypothetical protein